MTNKEYTPSVEPWALGNDLLNDTLDARKFADLRYNLSANTQRGVSQRLGNTAIKYANILAFIKSPVANAEIPNHDTTMHFNNVEAVVTLKDIRYSKYIKDQSRTDIGLQLVAAFTDDMFQVLPPTARRSVIDSGGLINLPLNDDIKISYIPDQMTNLETPEQIAHTSSDSFDYMAHVRSIEALNSDFIQDAHPNARNAAAYKLLENMNYQHPLIGNSIEATSANLRRPNPLKDEGYLTYAGTVRGILRKFVTGPYVTEEGDVKSGVQAVVWRPEYISMIQNSLATPQQVDKSSDTTFIPLLEPHSIIASSPEQLQ
jgi:hypothetical protein